MGRKNQAFKQKMKTAMKRYNRDKAYIKYPDLDKPPSIPPGKLRFLLQRLDEEAAREQAFTKSLGTCPRHHLILTVRGICPLECGYQKGASN
jgi:hypothetical protein